MLILWLDIQMIREAKHFIYIGALGWSKSLLAVLMSDFLLENQFLSVFSHSICLSTERLVQHLGHEGRGPSEEQDR